MARKKTLLALFLGLALLTSVGACLGLLLHHEPHFYRDAAVPAGENREKLSGACRKETTKLIGYFLEGFEPWDVQFTEAQINSFFAEDFLRIGDDAKNLEKQGVSAPRVSIEKDRLRLAFRYTNALVSTVVSLDLKIWLVPRETNVFAIEILGRYAGGLPISAQTLQEEIANLARKYNLEASWYRHDGHPVALLHFKSKESRPTNKFLRFELTPGQLSISGVSLEPLPPNAQKKTVLAPVGN